jgi:hypothetical protein
LRRVGRGAAIQAFSNQLHGSDNPVTLVLTAGSRFGPYGFNPPSGPEGRARSIAHDAKLNWEVAIKILPEAFTVDADRLARFKREASMPS